ncbi:uncharacterized protein LOC143287438 [Babylonia areolata]|uniref:uncharacterized protein LOC143287438 n=1 Tax=Babylonia areolata TaxID=304850 RepID=UPI003FD1BB26
MARIPLFALLGLATLLSATQASALTPDSNPNSVYDPVKEDPLQQQQQHATVGLGSDDDDIVDEAAVSSPEDLADDDKVEEELREEEKGQGQHVDFPVSQMDDEELRLFLGLEERIFWGEADEHVALQLLREKRSLFTKGGGLLRRKRIAPLIARAAFAVARGLARRFVRSGITRSGSRVTRHYTGSGRYGDAVRDFNRMRPTDVRSFNGRISGRTGRLGNHRVTVRDGSRGNSRPTLEIRSHGGDLVRKFRYNP